MQVHNGTQVAVVSANGQKQVITAVHPRFDALVLNVHAPKLSVEYARARDAINGDFADLVKKNEALAKRIRRGCKDVVVEALGGKVSKGKDEKGGMKLLVTFPDHSVARL